jgi:hypothetical protein
MSPAHILDKYYLAITLLVTVGYQLSGFAIAWTFQFDKITDFTGGSNFFILGISIICLDISYLLIPCRYTSSSLDVAHWEHLLYSKHCGQLARDDLGV